MLTKLFFPTVAGVRVDRAWWEGHGLHLAASTTGRVARCPLCGRRSKRVHSRYTRLIADLPCAGARVMLHLLARRFVCRVRWCRRKIFTERSPALVAPWARRTSRLHERLQRIGFDLGGAPGAQHARAAGLAVSRRTLLRLVRAARPPESGPVRVLGVDDWAQRRGRVYGTILVNLETRRVIDLLPDRTAETFAAWLAQHPEVEIISRDRGGAYAEGARLGAPEAIQVADRFHLLRNVTEALERFLIREYACLQRAAQALVPPPTEPAPAQGVDARPEVTVRPARTRKEQERLARRSRKLARYEEVLALRAQGHSVRAIAAQTYLDRRTVRRYLQAEGFPENQPRARRSTPIGRFVPYLRERWVGGCRNAKQLWCEIRHQGFTGGYTTLTDVLRAWREPCAHRTTPCRHGDSLRHATSASPTPAFSARQTLWLLLRPDADRTPLEQGYLTQLYQLCPQVALAQALVQEFAAVLREHDIDGLYAWLGGTGACPIRELNTVARGMWLDRQAIVAAVTTDWSNGPTEGHVNRINSVS